MRRPLVIILLVSLLPRVAAAESLEFHAPASVYDTSTPAVMRDLASRIIPVYRNDNREQYLDNMSALQLAAGTFEPAYSARLELRQLRGGNLRRPAVVPALVYDLFAHTKSLQAQYRLPFSQAFDLAFWETIPIFDNLDAYRVETWLEAPASAYAATLQASFDRLRGHTRITQSAALGLIWQYLAFDAYDSFGPIAPGLISLDDDRRYIIQDDVTIDTRGRAKVLALLVRPRSSSGLLTTLLEYRIAPGGHEDAIEAAAYGFAGMVAFTPRVRVGRLWRVIPFEAEGAHADEVIAWIAKQPWSDAQVGMYGDGYSGFVAWAAAKRLPPELKAIAASDAMAPGIDFPMDGGIALNSAYCWLEGVQSQRDESAETTSGGADTMAPSRLANPVSMAVSAPPEPGGPGSAVTPGQATRTASPPPGSRAWCHALDAKWYASGKPFRDLPRLAGRPSEIFDRWLAHPAYDEYWRRLVPTPREFANLDIPVLSISGYYSPGEAGALFYFSQHNRYDPQADQILLLGPYDRAQVRAGRVEDLVHGYRMDPAAVVDLRTLELRWFAYLFLNDDKPALLARGVNFEVMGANAWQHADALDALAKSTVRLYLAADPHAGSGKLTPREPAGHAAVRVMANLASRHDGGELPPQSLITGSVPVENGFAFVSGPLPGGLEVNGRISGRLLVGTNKRDLDLTVSLYELLPEGNYFHLFAPAEEFRASYLRDRARRQLLVPGRAQWLTFTGERITAVRIDSGARLVLVLRVSKRPDREINYGLGGAVSWESIAAGRVPVRLSLPRGSYIDLPIREEAQAPPPAAHP
ncbi:MAG: CocE/NonD family hydrolase [Steroidobacteraceae bacterium]